MVDPIVIYSFILGVTILSLVLCFLVFSYKKTLVKFYTLWSDEDKVKASRQEANEIVAHAQKEAQDILEKAHSDASALMGSSHKFTQAEQGTFSDEIQKALEIEVTAFRETLDLIKNETKTAIDTEIKKISSEAFSNLNAEEGSVKKELEEYKKKAILDLQNNFWNIISDSAANVLGQTVDPKEHHEIVMKVLREELAKNGF